MAAIARRRGRPPAGPGRAQARATRLVRGLAVTPRGPVGSATRNEAMAKVSQGLRDEKRDKLIEKHAAKRAELRSKLKDPEVDPDEKFEVMAALGKLPRNSCPT